MRHHYRVVQRVADTNSLGEQARPAGVERVHRIAAGTLTVLVLAQAVIAGHALFGDWEIMLHGFLGNASFAVGVIMVALSIASRAGPAAVALAGTLALAMFAQVGLGYVGRTSLSAASWHVPLGVTIFGLATCNAMLAHQRSSHRSTGTPPTSARHR